MNKQAKALGLRIHELMVQKASRPRLFDYIVKLDPESNVCVLERNNIIAVGKASELKETLPAKYHSLAVKKVSSGKRKQEYIEV